MIQNLQVQMKQDDEGDIWEIRFRIKPKDADTLLAFLGDNTSSPRKVRDETIATPLLTALQKESK